MPYVGKSRMLILPMVAAAIIAITMSIMPIRVNAIGCDNYIPDKDVALNVYAYVAEDGSNAYGSATAIAFNGKDTVDLWATFSFHSSNGQVTYHVFAKGSGRASASRGAVGGGYYMAITSAFAYDVDKVEGVVGQVTALVDACEG